MRWGFTSVLAALLLLGLVTPARAQEPSILRLELTRPDAKTETLTGRRLSETPAVPADEAIRPCGDMQISLRKLQYSETAGFGYYFVLKHSETGQWEEWLVHRDDGGRFTSQRLDDVKVFAHKAAEPDCRDFKLPLYCLAGCGENPWWTLSDSAPKTLTIYLGAGSFWNLLLKKNLPFPATILEPAVSMNTGEDPWHISVVLSPQGAPDEGDLQLRVAPKWTKLQNILFHQDGLTARLTYRSEVNDKIADGVSTRGEASFPVVAKPEPWLLVFPLVLGSALALLVRKLAWQDVKSPTREWFLVTLVALIALVVGYATSSGVEVANVKVSADGFLGAGIVGLTTGLTGRKAVDRLYKLFGIQEAS